MRLLKNFVIGVCLLLGGIALLMLIPSPQAPAEKPWEVTIMPDGNSKVLGIHLGQTDYKTAQQQLGVFGKTAVFVDPDGSRSVEAYFDSINLGGLSAKLVLNLGVDAPVLAAMLERGSGGKLQPSGAHQHELAETDREFLLQTPVMALTYIPSVSLKPEMVETRFGRPDTIAQSEADEEGRVTETWSYPDVGLSAVFQPQQKTILIFRVKS